MGNEAVSTCPVCVGTWNAAVCGVCEQQGEGDDAKNEEREEE